MAFAFLATFGLSFLQIGEVDLDDPAATVARRYADSRGQVGLGVLLILLSLFFFLVFIAWLYRWLRDVEGPGGWLAPLAVVSGAVMIATISAVVLVSLAGTVLEDYGADPVIARTLLVLQARAVAIVFPPTAAFLGATSLVGFNRGVLPKWLTYSGLAIALGLLLALLPFFLGALWVGMLAALLLQRGRMGRT